MSDRILGTIVVLLAGSMAWAARDYAAIVAYEPVGPRAFPLLLAALLAVCGTWLVLRPSQQAEFSPAAFKTVLFCAGVIVLYAALFQFVGFILATALMAIPVGRIFGGNWRQSALYGLLLGVILFIMFDMLLDVVLPLGLIKPLLSLMGA
jgi:putative tricarboxylic transport membrane protein